MNARLKLVQAPRQQDQTGLSHEFKQLSEEYARMLGEAGSQVLPYRSAELPHFAKLSPELQQQAIEDARLAVGVFSEMAAEKHALKDSPKLLWRSLRRLGLTPCLDIFDRIEEGDVVNVYSPSQKQIFQNLRFFDFCSLTVEEVFCTEWYTCSVRSDEVKQRLYLTAVALLSGQIQGTIDPGVEEHEVQQASFTEEECRFLIKVKWASPVTKNGQIAGMIVVNRCTHLA